MALKCIGAVLFVVISLFTAGFCDLKTIDLVLWRNEYNIAFYHVAENYTGEKDIQFNPETVYDSHEFLLRHSELSSFPRNIFDVVANVRTIEIRKAGMKRLKQSDFIGGSSLTRLDLIDNKISELPSEPFAHLKSLKTLFLAGNPIAALGVDTFSGLTNLEDLMLTDMQFTSIPTDLFKPLPNLDDLLLSSNKIPEIQEGVFSNNLKLQSLSLNRCSTKYLHPNALDNLDMRYLDISDNSYESSIYLPKVKYVKAQNANIKELHLDGTCISLEAENNRLERFELNDLSQILQLRLENNQVSDVSFLSNMGSLRELGLSGNPVQVGLTKEFFDDKPQLRLLYLANMNLTDLPVGLFDGSKELWQMNLANNQFSYLDIGVFKNLKKLSELDLRGNPLVDFDVDGLKEAGVRASILGTIDDQYRYCRYVLESLTFSPEVLEYLNIKIDKNEVEECKKLLKYYIDNNKMNLL